LDPVSQFRDALTSRQLIPPAEIIADGKFQRCDVEGKNGRNDGSYLLHLDGVPAGGFQNHKDGKGWQKWRADLGRNSSITPTNALRTALAAKTLQRDALRAHECEDVRVRAEDIWEASAQSVGDHAYLDRKQIKAHGARVYLGEEPMDGVNYGDLVVPMADEDALVCQLQLISPDGSKRFLKGPKPPALYYKIGKCVDVICIAEGFATAASVHEATGYPVAVAFGCRGLGPVAEAIRKASPDLKIVMCADDDYKTDGDPGVTQATAAAMATRGFVAIPNFGSDRPDDCTDFNDLARELGGAAVRKCIEAAAQPEPIPTPPSSPRPAVIGEVTIGLVCANAVTPEAIDWLWDGWLAAGKLHIIAGAPATGKTTVALKMAATVSSGGTWPDGTSAKIGQVLIWSGEDNRNDTLVPRLAAMGANLDNIHFIDSAGVGKTTRPFDPATDMEQLSAACRQLDIKPDLLIVDPIVSAVAGDSHKNTETRRALQPIVDLGVSEHCAVLGITHFTKGSAGRSPVERVTGSLAFAAIARVVYVTGRKPTEQGGQRFIVRAKSNVGADSDGYEYELHQDALLGEPGISGAAVTWGKAIEGNARDILAKAEVVQAQESRTQTDEAQDWLREVLAAGPVKAAAVLRMAKEAGISDKTLRSARERLEVKPGKSAFNDGWVWSLPPDEDALPDEDAQVSDSSIEGTFESEGHLRAAVPIGLPPDAEVF
jgi:putative DNA primase/helicase